MVFREDDLEAIRKEAVEEELDELFDGIEEEASERMNLDELPLGQQLEVTDG